ncbi:MAG: MMPL family transporter [Deltaproteobacteria bacterium]|nr:MMPL family transporter [Deltaproteobacteria bacterium]
MQKLFLKINQVFEKMPDKTRQNRWKIWIGFLLILIVIAAGLPRLKFDMSMESWFRKSDPVAVAFNLFRDSFGGDDSVYIVYRAKDGDIFSEKSLRAVKKIQEDILNATLEIEEGKESILEHILDVKTLINVSYMDVQDDTLISRDFIGDNIPTDEAAREHLRKQALTHKDYPLFYLSKDSQYGGIYIRTDFGAIPVDSEQESGAESEKSGFDQSIQISNTADTGLSKRIPPRFKNTEMGEYAEFTNELLKIVRTSEFAEDLELYPVGNPVLMNLFNEILNIEMSYIFLATLLLIFLILYILFRSWSAVIWPISIVILTTILTLGLMGWLNATMSMMFSLLTMLILVVGVADAVHIFSGYLFFRRRELDHQTALRAVYKKSGFACLLTSVTTSLGLLAMVIVPIPPIALFGVSAAIGVLTAFALTVFILPLMLDIWHPISKKQEAKLTVASSRQSWIQRYLDWLAPLSQRYPRRIVLIFLIIGCVATFGLLQVKVDSNMVEIIRKGHPYPTAVLLIDKVMGGTQSMEVHLGFRKMDALKDPRVLNAMEKLQQYLESQQGHFVVKTDSLVNVVKNSYQVLNENRPEMYIIPQDRPSLEQTLFLFDSANPDDRQLLVTDDYREGRIAVRLYNYGSIAYLDFLKEVKQKISELFDPLKSDFPGIEVQITGGLALMMQMIDYISWSQIQSFGLALIVISILLLFVFGSLKLGLIALIPNIFPVLMTFGTMGLLGIPLDGDTLIIAPIVIGIAVDDTIHFLSHFRVELSESGKITDAIVLSIKEVGQAISFSTIILVLGFLTLTVSTHMGMARFGYLTAIAFISALLADLLLLPALCYLTHKSKEYLKPVA